MGTRVIADTRLRKLENKQAREQAFVPDDKWYNLLIAPSCPPDKRLHIRRGIVSPGGRWGFNMQDDYIPNWICDFENETETQMALSFTNANYYLGIILCYYGEWAAYRTLGGGYSDPVFDNVIGTEVAMAAEAEAQLDAYLNGTDQWYYYRVPLWGVVLRNDGQVGVNYAILPVDIVNRGRSYLYRDARAKYSIFP